MRHRIRDAALADAQCTYQTHACADASSAHGCALGHTRPNGCRASWEALIVAARRPTYHGASPGKRIDLCKKMHARAFYLYSFRSSPAMAPFDPCIDPPSQWPRIIWICFCMWQARHSSCFYQPPAASLSPLDPPPLRLSSTYVARSRIGHNIPIGPSLFLSFSLPPFIHSPTRPPCLLPPLIRPPTRPARLLPPLSNVPPRRHDFVTGLYRARQLSPCPAVCPGLALSGLSPDAGLTTPARYCRSQPRLDSWSMEYPVFCGAWRSRFL